MSKKTLSWLLIFSIIINISTIATFSYYRWFKSTKQIYAKQRSSHRESLSKKLGLTEEQSKKIKDLRSDLWKEIKSLRTQLNDERQQFVKILKQDIVDTNTIYEKIDKISEIQKKMQLATVKNMLEHQSILTPEQRKRFFAMMTKRMHRGGEPRHKSSSKFKREKSIPEQPKTEEKRNKSDN